MNNLFEGLKKSIDTRLPKGDMSGIRLRDVRWSVKTAGPSPNDNLRVELFLLGCKRAMSGNPCKGCFNSSTWNDNSEWTHDPVLMAKHINNMAPNKYITIGGGEPLDQIDNLIILCKELKKYGFHVIVYTWRDIDIIVEGVPIYNIGTAYRRGLSEEIYNLTREVGRNRLRELMDTIDIIIDGEYKEEERMWDGSKEDGLLSSIGSGNQRVIELVKEDGHLKAIGPYMRNIKSLKLGYDNKLEIVLKGDR